MASKKKPVKNTDNEEIITIPNSDEQEVTTPTETEPEVKIKTKTKTKEPKYALGSIVFVEKATEADLNGFKLFPPYKKYTYTVEAYDENTEVYSLRRLNLSLKLKESDIVAPYERAHDPLNRRQF